MEIEFRSKPPHHTWGIYVRHEPKDNYVFGGLASTLIEAGWQIDPIKSPPLDNTEEDTFYKDGTSVFCEWTDEEKRDNIKEAKAILRSLGLLPIKHHKLTASDLA